jgi:hypothetical protein
MASQPASTLRESTLLEAFSDLDSTISIDLYSSASGKSGGLRGSYLIIS